MTRIQLRRGTAAEWTAENTLLGEGEVGLETDTGLSKHGDGVTAWNSLAYAGFLSPGGIDGGTSSDEPVTVLSGGGAADGEDLGAPGGVVYRIQKRRATAAEWTSEDPVLAVGEEGYETDTGRSKIGNGVDAWSDRPYVNAVVDVCIIYGAVGDAVALTDATVSSGSAICTSASNAFTASMVGKTIVVAGAGAADGLTALVTTVASYQSAGQITLSDAASHDAVVDGGPNVSAIVGTDNSTAFEAAFTAAAAAAVAAGSYRARYQNVVNLFVPGGNYLVTTGVSALQVQGLALFGDGMFSTRIWYCGSGPFLQMGTYSSSPSSVFEGTAGPFRLSHLTLAAPVYTQAGFIDNRPGYGIQDNGSGDLRIDNVLIAGFGYGVYGAYGSDFSTFGPNARVTSCDTGIYLGPGSEQVLLHAVDISNCEEGLVNEGAPHGALVGCSFEDNATADITYDGQASGTTRSGVAYNIAGAMYLGAWTHTGCWFESGANGTTDRNCDHHIWIKSVAYNWVGWRGLAFRDCILVSGGRAQVPGGTNSFITDVGDLSANPVIDGLHVGGDSINGLYYYDGAAATSDASLRNYYIVESGSVVPFTGISDVSTISNEMSPVVSSSGTITLDNVELTDSLLTAPRVSALHDPTNDVTALNLVGVSSGVNYVEIVAAASGNSPQVRASGTANLTLRPGSGGKVVIVDSGLTAIAHFAAPASPVNYWQFSAGATGNSITAEVKTTSGSDPNVNMNLIPRGAGVVQANGVQVATVSGSLTTPTVSTSLTLADAANIIANTTTGSKIGTATSQKIGVWNATPIVQPTTAVAEGTFVENAGGTAVNVDSTFDGYTLQQVVKALRNIGLLA